MISIVPDPVVPAADLTTRAHIRDTALALFAEHGFKAVTVRRIAEQAGTSTALLFHHFGNKAGIQAAVEAAIVDRLNEISSQTPVEGDPETVMTETFRRIANVGRTDPHIVNYMARSLMEGSDQSIAFFRVWVERLVNETQRLEAAGVLQPTQDVVARALLLISIELGPVLMRRQVEAVLGVPMFDPVSTERWVQSCLEVFKGGVLASTSSTTQSPDQGAC